MNKPTPTQEALNRYLNAVARIGANANRHDPEDVLREVGREYASLAEALNSVKADENDIEEKFDLREFEDCLEGTINDAFSWTTAQIEELAYQRPIDPYAEHRHGHREYGLEGA